MTNKKSAELEQALKEQEVEDFASAGSKATYTVYLEKGVEALDGYGHGLEPYLKQLGLPIKLNMQKLELLSDTYVCREGETLNVEQAKILKLLGHKMSTFKPIMLAARNAKGQLKVTDQGKHHLDTN